MAQKIFSTLISFVDKSVVVNLNPYNRALFTIIHDIYIHYSALSCFYHRYLVAAACVNFGVVKRTVKCV